MFANRTVFALSSTIVRWTLFAFLAGLLGCSAPESDGRSGGGNNAPQRDVGGADGDVVSGGDAAQDAAQTCSPGQSGCACRVDDTCDGGLVCADGRCHDAGFGEADAGEPVDQDVAQNHDSGHRDTDLQDASGGGDVSTADGGSNGGDGGDVVVPDGGLDAGAGDAGQPGGDDDASGNGGDGGDGGDVVVPDSGLDTGAGDAGQAGGGDDADTADDAGTDAASDAGSGPEPGPYDDVTVTCRRALARPPAGELCGVTPGTNGFLRLEGVVLAGATIFENGVVLIDSASSNRRITCVGCECDTLPEAQAATVVSCPEGVISPGLINPHDHITFSLSHPRPHGEERFEHRHDWRRGLRGHSEINTSPGANSTQDGILYGELRMLLGGATSIAGSVGSNNARGLLRNLDNATYTEGLVGIDVDYRTFPLGDSNGALRSTACDYPNIDSVSRLNNPIYLPHIAEGIDPEARNEFVCMSSPEGAELVAPNTSIIHGIGLNALDILKIAQSGAKLVWSPRSNIDLYGNTADVAQFHALGIPIALGTDWTATGSMNMLRELQCADYLNRMHLAERFTDQDIWMMATVNAAIAMGAEDQLGLLLEDYVADIAIFDGRERAGYRAVIDADVQDVALVLRGGAPLYGAKSVIEGLVPPSEHSRCEEIDVCGQQRRVCVQRDTGKTITGIKGAVSPEAYPLFFCSEPEKEPSCVPFRLMEYTGVSSQTDSDGDGISDDIDNCPDIFNPIRPLDGGRQADADGDGLGDSCDPCPLSPDRSCQQFDLMDWDSDGVPNARDNCPLVANSNQADADQDGTGDACDPCPAAANGPGEPCPASIFDIKQGRVAPGERVTVQQAIVTAIKQGEGLFVQEMEGDEGFVGADFSGLYVYALGNTNLPAPGSRVTFSGQVANGHGQIQLWDVQSFQVHSSGNPLPAPVTVAPADVATGGVRREALEGVLVRVDNVSVTNTAPMPDPTERAPFNAFEVTGGLRVNDFFYLASPAPQAGTSFHSITGVLRWANNHSKLEPRSEEDFDAVTILAGISATDAVMASGTSGASVPELVVSLNRPAPQDTTLALTYSNPTVLSGPSSITIPAGERSATLSLVAVADADDVGEVQAALDGIAYFARVRVYGEATTRAVATLDVTASSVGIGASTSATLTLDVPAAAAGAVVQVTSAPQGVLEHADFVALAPGQRTASFEIVGLAEGTATLTAILGATSRSVTLAVTATSFGPCLIISEYIEGSGTNNKALELYNCGASALEKSNFGVCMVVNASTTCSSTFKLEAGLMAAGEVWTLCKSKTGTDGDPLAGIAWGCAQVRPTGINHTGDDRFVVFRDVNGSGAYEAGTDEVMDAFGTTATQPPSPVWADKTYRRCDFTPYDGTGPFPLQERYKTFALNDVSHFGVPPQQGCN